MDFSVRLVIKHFIRPSLSRAGSNAEEVIVNLSTVLLKNRIYGVNHSKHVGSIINFDKGIVC